MGKSGPRMLKGLSLDNLVEEDPEESIEQNGENKVADDKPVGRRSRRHRNDDAIYDMKYHPMDVVTRPNRAATIRHISKSGSITMDDYDDAESSEVSSASSSDEPDDDESEDEEKVNAVRPRVVLTPRTPHAGAVRHSARSEAHKQINYSTKSHPQDYALPGFKHRAPLHVPHPQIIISSSSPHKEGRKKRKHMLPTPEDDGQIDLLSAYDNAQEEEPEQRRPRKKLRSINPSIFRSPRSDPKPAKGSRGKSLEVPDSEDEIDADSEFEVDGLVDMALRASHPPPCKPQAPSNAIIEDTCAESMNDSQQQPPPPLNSAQPDEIPSEFAGDDDDEEAGDAPGTRQPESETPTTKEQAKEDQIAGQQSSGSLFSEQYLNDDQDHVNDVGNERQVEHNASTKDLADGHSEFPQRPDDVDCESRQREHSTQRDHRRAGNSCASQKQDNINNDTPAGSQSSGHTDSSEKQGDTSNTDQQSRHDSTRGDHNADGTSPSQKPDDVDDTDQQQYHDALTGNEITGEDVSSQQPDDGLDEGPKLQPQSKSTNAIITPHDLETGLFPESIPPQSHQPRVGLPADQEDGSDDEPDGNEEMQQPSDFEEQFGITEHRYKGQDSNKSFDPLQTSDSTHLLV